MVILAPDNRTMEDVDVSAVFQLYPGCGCRHWVVPGLVSYCVGFWSCLFIALIMVLFYFYELRFHQAQILYLFRIP